MSESPTDYASMAFGSSRRGFRTPTSDSRRPRPVRTTSSQFSSPRRKATPSPAIPRAKSQRHPKQQFWLPTPTRRQEKQNFSVQSPQHSSIPPPSSPTSNSSWVKGFDEHYKHEYFFNIVTKESVWQLPPGAKLARDTLGDEPGEKGSDQEMSVSEMKRSIEEKGLSHHDCITKQDLRERFKEATDSKSYTPIPHVTSTPIPHVTSTPNNNSDLAKQLELQLEISRENENAALQTSAAEVCSFRS